MNPFFDLFPRDDTHAQVRPSRSSASVLTLCMGVMLGTWAPLTWAKTLYVSPTGNDAYTYTQNDQTRPWRTLTKAGQLAVAGDTVYIAPGTYTTPLVVNNTGSSTARIVFTPTPGSAAKSVILEGEGVAISGKSYITVNGLWIRNVPQGSSTSGIGVVVEANRTNPSLSTRGVEITNNTISNTFGSAIGVWGAIVPTYPSSIQGVYLTSNLIEGACNGGWNEAITIARGVNGFFVRGNTVRNSLNTPNGGEGIDIKEGPINGEISGNRLYGLKKNAIYIDAGAADTPDVINLAPPVIKNVRIFNNFVYKNLDAAHGITVTSEGRGSIDGVYIYNNMVYLNSGMGINLYRHEWMKPTSTIKNVYVINNSLADNGQIRNTMPLDSAPWYGNMEVSNWGDASLSVPQFQNIVIKNNATEMSASFVNSIRGIYVGHLTPGQVFVSNNTDQNVQDNTDNRTPIFFNASTGALAIRSGSLAVDSGVVIAPYTNTDIFGNVRPKGLGIDQGALEAY